MSITLVTGVPGSGKTAKVVSMILEAIDSGRPVFVDGVKGLHLTTEFYRAGRIIDWHKSTWLHVDQYRFTDGSEVLDDDDDGSANWLPNPDVFLLSPKGEFFSQPKTFPILESEGKLKLVTKRDEMGFPLRWVDYETHKGAIVFIDEAQRYFRPRPIGSKVPDYVAAFEVHRHQGLDFVLISQRPTLIDSNIRGLITQHFALRNGWFGRYLYEWAEVGDVENKMSRETAAKTRFKLPAHVFQLYDSAAVHTKVKRKFPFAAKILIFIIPAFFVFGFFVYGVISGKSKQPAVSASTGFISKQPIPENTNSQESAVLVSSPISDRPHPFSSARLFISSYIASSSKKLYYFKAVADGGSYNLTQSDLISSGYTINPLSDCSVELIYESNHFFVSCQPTLETIPSVSIKNETEKISST
jgi:zona occludens toxin (predicted ATPase)